ncbi:unnamed protein product [Penicillium olsonii]|nr:unnamed protein product [Penicillium olsonii]
MSSTIPDILSNGRISSSISSFKSRSVPKGNHSIRSTRKHRALSWGDMSPGATWDMTVSLSKLTRDMVDVPIIDIEQWVRRPVEERKRETEQKKKIGRPLNSFMLYRLAYTNRIKMCSRRRSPQVVSSIAGKSWHKEPQNVRDKYRRLAQIERDGHALAYPDYKLKLPSRKRPFVADSTADIESYGLSENNVYERSPIHGFQIATPSPINNPSSGLYAEGMQGSPVADMEGFQGSNSCGLFGIPCAAHYGLMCLETIDLLPSIFADGNNVYPQRQSRL